VDDVGWKRLWRLAATSLSIGMVSGCGAAALTEPGPDTGSAIPAATKTPDPTGSVRYCQLLDNGEWVTNDRANSTNPCVPDPSYATGDEQADASVAVPRCYTCKLSDWKHAERRAAERIGQTSAAPTAATAGTNTADVSRWSTDVHRSFVSDCTAYLDGSLCECLANHLAWRVPPEEAQSLSGGDPRVQVAVRDCRS
jgi:hypothetical protein